jgi:hypothetical protein
VSYDPTKPIEIHAVEPSIVRVDSRTPAGTDAERIRAAREKHIEQSKRASAQYGGSCFHDGKYWADAAGYATSECDFERVLHMLSLPVLAHPKFLGFSCNREFGRYHRLTAVWTASAENKFVPCAAEGDTYSLAELKKALAERIAELKISEVLLVEWLNLPHPDSQAWDRQEFEDRMQTFREVRQ